jgi:hypothetical protein
MRRFTTAFGLLTALALTAPVMAQQEEMAMPEPQAEHRWLQQLVGDWSSEVHVFMEGQEMTSQGSEHVRAIGGFWTVAENKGEFAGQPFTGLQTLGFDPEKGKFVGTWVDSVNNYMWVYEGELDAAKKKLTLRTKGKCPMNPDGLSNFEEVIELKSPDHKVFTSSVQGKDGKWTKGMQIEYRRK